GMIPSLIKIPWMFLIVPITFIIFMIFGLVLQGVFYSKFERGTKGIIKVLAINFVFLFSYMFFYLLIIALIMNSFFYFGSFLPFAIPLFILVSVFSTHVYQKSENIIAGSIVNTLFFSLLICTISPYQSGLSFILGFFF
ncbi:MAG: hypothetical protein ACFE8N_06010, partial [Promethearchaeota archaeon]